MSKKILIVEDDPVLRSLTKEMLGMIQIESITAANYEIAVKEFSNNADDIGLVICDMHLDEFTGIDVLKAIRKIRPEVPIVLASGIIDEMNEKELKNKGFNDFIQKPFRMKKLHQICKEYIN